MRRRVVRIITRLNVGGPTRHVAHLAEGLGALGYETVVATGSLAPGEGSLRGLVEEAGAEVVDVPGLGRAVRPLDDLRALAALVRLLRRVRPAIVHTHLAKAGALGRVAARIAGVPRVVHTFHGHVLEGYFGPLASEAARAAERALATLTDRIIAIAPRQRRDLVRRFRVAPRGRVALVPLGIDLARYRGLGGRRGALRAEIGAPADALLVGAVGRLVPVKRPDLLVGAFARALARAPGAHLVWAGDGPLREATASRARALGIADRVHLIGNRPDLVPFYADLDLLALSSRNEGTPLGLIEALAASVPAVATAVGGVPDVVGASGAALLTPEGDEAALADAIASLLLDPRRRETMARAAPEAAARFDHRRLVRDIAALYDGLLASPR